MILNKPVKGVSMGKRSFFTFYVKDGEEWFKIVKDGDIVFDSPSSDIDTDYLDDLVRHYGFKGLFV